MLLPFVLILPATSALKLPSKLNLKKSKPKVVAIVRLHCVLVQLSCFQP